MTTARTRLFALLGHPVAHSVSPAMHTALFRRLGIDAVYLALDVASEALPEAVAGLAASGVAGFNVTVPHKTAIVPLLSGLDPIARQLGAVNLVYRDGEGRLRGENVDAPGLARALETVRITPAGRRCVVLGAGGAAPAAVWALVKGGAAEVALLNRTVARAESLAARLARALETDVAWGPLEDACLEEAELVVNATSAGLDGHTLPIDASRLRSGATLYDMVYGPRPSPLVQAARARGLRAVDGLSMLVHQGALSAERWLGRRLDAQDRRAMRRAARRALADAVSKGAAS